MEYEIWRKWYAEAVVSGNTRVLKKLIRIGELHGWIKTRRR